MSRFLALLLSVVFFTASVAVIAFPLWLDPPSRSNPQDPRFTGPSVSPTPCSPSGNSQSPLGAPTLPINLIFAWGIPIKIVFPVTGSPVPTPLPSPTPLPPQTGPMHRLEWPCNTVAWYVVQSDGSMLTISTYGAPGDQSVLSLYDASMSLVATATSPALLTYPSAFHCSPATYYLKQSISGPSQYFTGTIAATVVSCIMMGLR